jgi:hypothetical protein
VLIVSVQWMVIAYSLMSVTSDATAVYTNIELAVGITAVKAWLSEYESELPRGFLYRIVIEALELVMTRTFQFDDTFSQQFVGTVMGTPCASKGS